MEGLNLHPDTLKQIDTQRHREAINQARIWRLGRARMSQTPKTSHNRWGVLHQISHALLGLWRHPKHSDVSQVA